MKKIVLSASVVTAATVGAYHILLMLGVNNLTAANTAIAVAGIVGIVVAIVTFFAVAPGFISSAGLGASVATVAFFAVGFAEVTTVVFSAFATPFAAVVSVIVFGTSVTFTVIAAIAAAEQDVRIQWAFAAYLGEMLTIAAAIMVGHMGHTGWSITIMLIGVIALLFLWRLAPKSSPEELAKLAMAAEIRKRIALIHVALGNHPDGPPAMVEQALEMLAQEQRRLDALEALPASDISESDCR